MADPTPPDGSTPDTTTPDGGVPDETTSGGTAPDSSIPDSSTPDSSTPDSSTPDSSTPDSSTSDSGPQDPSTQDVSTPDATTDSSAQNLQDAGADANTNAGPENVGDPAPCPVDSPPGGAPPQQPGALIVTVTNSVDGSVIQGATANLSSGSGPASAITDASGTATFNPLPPDIYQITAAKPGFVQGTTVSASVPPGSTSSPVSANVQLTDFSCTPSAAVSITWGVANQTQTTASGSSTTLPQQFVVAYRACIDTGAGLWHMRVASISGNVDISIHTGASRNPDTNPPTSQAEAVDAVTLMKGYYARGGRGAWHTAAASIAHENHHYREWKCSAEHYWATAQTDIESLTLPLASASSPATAAAAMKSSADGKIANFFSLAQTYFGGLGDGASDRPYAAGQLVLNASVQAVQALASAKGWAGVPSGVDSPNTEPPCYNPFP